MSVEKMSDLYETLMQHVPPIVLTYMLWTVVHFVSAHLYVTWCTGNTLFGLLASPLFAASPHCQAISWLIYTISQKFVQMWLLLGTYLCTKMLLSSEKK